MAVYSNVNGTTQSSFKIGANGVLLASDAVSNGSLPTKYLITNQKYTDSGNVEHQLRVAFEFADEDPLFKRYDSFIRSTDIKTISVTNGAVTLTLQNNSIIILNKSIAGPNSSTDNGIALFDGIDGSAIKDSGKTITESIASSNPNNNSIPTVSAVIGYVGTLSDALEARLNGML